MGGVDTVSPSLVTYSAAGLSADPCSPGEQGPQQELEAETGRVRQSLSSTGGTEIRTLEFLSSFSWLFFKPKEGPQVPLSKPS